VEATARVDYPALSGAFDDATAHAVSAWAGIRARHVKSLLAQAATLIPDAATTDVSWIDHLALDPQSAEPIYEAIVWAVALGQAGALQEARDQGATLPAAPTPVAVADAADAHGRARGLERLLAVQLLQVVKREGMRLAGTRTSALLALSRALGDAPTRGERNTLKAGSTGGVNEGRLSVFRMIRIGTPGIQAAEGDPPPLSEQVGYLYATELLDDRTCDPCGAIDGTQYASLDDASNDYPGLGGGYVWCDGRENCRGSLVVVYADVAAPTVDGGSSQAQAIADRVAREQIQQDAIDRRAAADARDAFRGIPPPSGEQPLPPGAPPQTPPPTPPSGLVVQALRDVWAGTRVDVTSSVPSWDAERLTGMMQSEKLTQLGLRVEANSRGSISGSNTAIGATIRGADNRSLGTLSRAIGKTGPDSFKAEHGSFHLEPELQGKGIARELLASHVREYDAAGITRVEVTAAGDNGRYTWARFGFDFNFPSAAELDPNFPALPPHDLTSMRESFRTQLYQRVIDTLPKTIDVGGTQVVPGPELALRTTYPESMKLIDEATHTWDFAGLLINENGVEMTGKEMMLKGPGWYGSLDLTPGSEGRAIFDAYTRQSR